MRHVLILSLALVLAAPSAIAGACGPDTPDDIPIFEEAKAAFLATEYRRFADLAGNYFPDLDQRFDDYFGQVQVVFPNGYDRCVTILQRRETPGFHQDLVFYFPKGWDAPLTLHIVGAEVDGEVRMIEFTYNTAISDVIDDLK